MTKSELIEGLKDLDDDAHLNHWCEIPKFKEADK